MRVQWLLAHRPPRSASPCPRPTPPASTGPSRSNRSGSRSIRNGRAEPRRATCRSASTSPTSARRVSSRSSVRARGSSGSLRTGAQGTSSPADSAPRARRSRAADDPGARSSPTTRTSGSRSARTATRSNASTTADSRAGASRATRRRSSWPILQARSGRWRQAGRGWLTTSPDGNRSHIPAWDRRLYGRAGRPVPPVRGRRWISCSTRPSAGQLARVHVAAGRRHRADGVGAAERGPENALLTWTACGGDLMFVDGDLGRSSRQGRAVLPVTANGAACRYFFGHIHFRRRRRSRSEGFGRALTAADAAAQDTELGVAGEPCARLGRSRSAAFGCRFPVSTASRRVPIC